MSQSSRREFIKKAAVTSAGLYVGANAFSAKSYSNIFGANDRVRVGVVFLTAIAVLIFPVL